MLSIRQFCKDRMIPKKIEDAFYAYCKASLSEYYDIRAGDTLSKIIVKMRDDEIVDLWKEFTSDLKKIILSAEDHAAHTPSE